VEVTSSLLATLALLLWMPISLAAFSWTKPHRAVAFLLIFGTIFLPELEFFNIKFLPDMDKSTIACGWAFFPALIWARGQLKRASLGTIPWLLFGLLLVVDIGRALTNPDTLVIGGRVIGGILTHTALTFVMKDFLVVFVPFYLGAALFSQRDTLRDFVRIFCTAGLIYLPFVLLELRFSPQLHYWVYGFLQHSWLQVMRDGGYRPMVFMHHGLAVALFMGTCALLAFGLARAKERIWRFKALHVALVLSVVLGLSHSLGAFLLLVALTPIVWFMSARTQLRVATMLGMLVMFYPMLRAYDWFPTDAVTSFARSISEDRAGSIEFRFHNEDILLDRALERPFFGWGGFDRIFVYDEESGDEASTFDGAWLITYSASGVFGFVARFGLLTYPIWRAYKRVRRVPVKSDQLTLAAMGMATAMVSLDLLPNGMFTYFPHLFAGVLLGATRELSRREVSAPTLVMPNAAGARNVRAAASVQFKGA
jgi:hypothetical protein